MRMIMVVLVSLAMILWNTASAQTESLPLPSVEDFLGTANFWSPELSPSGQYLSGVRSAGEDTYLVVTDISEQKLELKSIGMGDVYLNWVEWVTDNRLLLSVTGYVNWNTGKQMTREQLKDIGRREWPVPYTRLIAMDRDGSNAVTMFGDDRRMNRNFSLGRVVSFLPQDADHILMAARRRGDLDLFKLNVLDGSFERIAEGTNNTYRWYVDRDGIPAFRFNTNRRGTVIYIYAREERSNGKIKWRKIKTIRLKRNQADESATEFSPLYAGPTETTYYVAARPEGEDKTGIYLYDFEKDEYVETIRSHPDVDIDRAIYNRETREIQGTYYYDDRLVLEFDDPEIDAHLKGLDVYFDKKANVLPIDSSKDGRIWLVKVSGPLDAGSYHIYYLDEARARRIANNFSALANRAFGDTEVIHYQARDGLALRGYLTRPYDADPGDQPPLIMMPHGGPEVRDIITFDFTVQLLVSQGYQVFQPNFRGSSGFGKIFADRGRREWGKAMQTDVDDALAHLVAEGIAAPDRACIYGASYGGYSALVAATLTPDMYQCAISVAGPSDLIEMLKWERKEEGRNSEAYKYWVEHIGNPRKDKDAIRAVSPARLADNVTRPILLIHGENDGIVPIKQTELMAKALNKAGKYYQQVTLENSRHTYRSDEDEEIEFNAVLAFLKTHLPVDEKPYLPEPVEVAEESETELVDDVDTEAISEEAEELVEAE